MFGGAGCDGYFLGVVFEGGGVGGGVGAEAEDDGVVNAATDGFELGVGYFGTEEVGDAAGCCGEDVHFGADMLLFFVVVEESTCF